MTYEIIDDIDYENLDDLPLIAHIEWCHLSPEENASDDYCEMEWLAA